MRSSGPASRSWHPRRKASGPLPATGARDGPGIGITPTPPNRSLRGDGPSSRAKGTPVEAPGSSRTPIAARAGPSRECAASPGRAHALPPRSPSRSASDVKIEVWNRDKGRCVECGATNELHFVEGGKCPTALRSTQPAEKGQNPLISLWNNRPRSAWGEPPGLRTGCRAGFSQQDCRLQARLSAPRDCIEGLHVELASPGPRR